MNDSTAPMSNGGRNESGRPRHRVIAVVCLTALGLSALVATGPVEATSALPAQATTTGTSVSTSEELRNAVTNIGGVINLAPGDYNLTSQLEIRRNGTQLRAVEPGTTTLAYTGSPSTSRSRVLEVWATGVVVDGVKITGGKNPIDDGGGGVEVERGANLRLSQSWVTGNEDSYGGGVFNEGTITIVDSTISGNTATIKGGGLLNEGTATVTNSTIEGNTSYWGSAIASFNTINLSHTTIVRNVTTDTSTSLGALQRFSGSFNVRYSVVGDNMRKNGSSARNCAGTVSLRTLNLVSSTTGCSFTSSDIVVTLPILVGSLQNNGGPTPTAGLLPLSPAIDGVDVSTNRVCVSGLTADQRGVLRPSGSKCDLGAFEQASLELADPKLEIDTASYESKGLPVGTVEVGATSVPSGLIAGEFAADATTDEDGTLNSARLRSIRLRSIRLRSIELQDLRLRSIETEAPSDPVAARLRSIELKANRLRSIALESIRLRSIVLAEARLRSIDLADTRLRSIPLSEIPLVEVPGGWEEFLATTEFAGVPLQSLTLADLGTVVPDDFTLASVDLSSTRLRSIRLRSILLEGTRLRSIPLSDQLVAPSPANDLAWCVALLGAADCAPPNEDPNTVLAAAVGDVELWEAQLAGADVDQESVLGVPLSGLTSTRLRSIDPDATDIEDARLRSIRLRSIFLENTALSAIRLSSIRLRSITPDTLNGLPAITLDSIIDCSNGACTDEATLTLGDVIRGCLPEESDPLNPENCLLQEGADLGQLLDLLGVEVEGVSLLDELTLADILLAFTPPEDIPWESVNLEAAGLQNIATPPQPTFDYVVGVEIAQGPATVTVDLTLPEGFALAEGAEPEAATFCPATTTCGAEIPPSDDTTTFVIPNVASGSYELRVPVRAGSTTGGPDQPAFQARSTVTATGPNGAVTKPSNDIGVTVVQANSIAPTAPSLRDGQLELGYIGGSGELDVYSFVAPAGTTGASARILLSNVPKDVDYDLAVYGPRPVSLRGAPLPERPAIGDDQFDLDPGDDVLATDIVDDIELDITAIAPTVGLDLPDEDTGYGLRDISSRRSNVDEEVTIPALVTGKTYVVVVSGYFSDVSPEPYGLRVRLDRRTAVPPCAANTYPGVSTVPVLPESLASLAISPSTKTLYVTNSARLDHEASKTPGATKTSSDILAAIAATDDVVGVNAGLLLLDDLPEWKTYNDNSCDPEVRNVLAKAIGAAIDTANGIDGARGGIENIVIVGGDGVVPMAAVPDLATYSNESTFALSVLDTAGNTTPPAGALASGYFLSDDPYATDAGISILGGDHELYVPDRNVGRLVETADEIIAQLTNFVTYGGKLDPRSFDAAVTGYDFLDDGAQAVIDELDQNDQPYNVDPLLDDDWDREDYLDLFRSGTDYRVFSPNAHYDFEALLPADPDTKGFYDDEDLVTTADFTTGLLGAATVPVRALGFTVGCHAGLSVSDVQVGPTLDWAQLYSQNNTQWVAHTTYGYGDTEIVAYSERLAELFAGNVAAMTANPSSTMSLGAAVTDAKQRYLASTLVISPYDEKILQSWTYYGLPMYTIGEPPAAPLSTLAVAEEPVAEEPVVEEPVVEEPVVEEPVVEVAPEPQGFRAFLESTISGPAEFGTAADNGSVPVAINVRAQLAIPTLDDPVGGSYYSVAGSIVSVQDRPVQPLVDVEIPGAGTDQYGGFLITGLESRDLPNTYVPFVSRPIVDNSIDESRFLAGDVAFPANLQQVTNLGNTQRLLVAAGQWQNGQRLFPEISGELLPRSGDDTDAPRFLDVTGTNIADVGASGRGIRFDVTTEHDSTIETDATRVVILFREENTSNWRTLELTGSGGNWFGVAALVGTSEDTRAEFFAQSVDAAGNVGITSNKIENFLSVDDEVATPPGSVTADIVPGGNEANGRYFGDGGSFSVTPSESTDAPATFSIDSGEPLPVGADGITIDVLPDGSLSTYDEETGVLGLAPGDYLITARFGDGPPTNRFFIVDGDPPTVTYDRDLSLWTLPVDSSLDVTATDTAGVARLRVTVTDGDTVLQDDQITGTEPNPGMRTIQVDPIVVQAGSSARPTLTVEVEDGVGNIDVLTSTLLVDHAAPSVTITPSSDVWSNSFVEFTVTASDPDSGLASVCVKRNGGTCEPIALTDGDGNGLVDTEGLTSLEVVATDNVGNVATDTTVVLVDITAPTGRITPDDGVWRTGSVTAIITADDPGGASASGIESVCVQRTAGCVELTRDADGKYGTDVTVPANADGTPTITVTITDVAGNETTVGPTEIRIDNKAPVVTLSSDQVGEWTNTAVTVTASATDGTGSGIAELCLDETCDETTPKTATVDPDSGSFIERTFTASATDKVGNLTDAEPIAVRVDRATPTVSVTADTDASTQGPVAFTIEADDVGSGIADVCVIIDGGDCTTVELDESGQYDTGELDIAGGAGTITVTANVTDVAGNINTANASATVDNIAPLVSISPKTIAWSTSAVGITITASDAESGLASVCLRRNGSTDCQPVALTNGVYTETVSTQGLTSLEVTATDNVGNKKSDSTEVRVDTVVPTVTITPNDTTWRTGTVAVTIAVADPGGTAASGIASVCVTTTGACIQLDPNLSGGYSTTLTVPTGTDGTPTISATARDIAGNATTAGPVPVKIDNKAPVLTLGSDQVATWSRVPVTVTATANDGTGSGLSELCLGSICGATSPSTVVVDPGAGNVAQPTFTATATDAVGNRAEAGPVTVKVDRAAPTATLSVSGTGTYRIGEAATVTFSCADVGSGIATCELLRSSDVVASPSPAPINTSTSGSQTYRVRATDVAGNTITTTATTVNVGFRTCVRNDSFQSLILPTYTLRLTLCDAAGNNLSSASIPLTALTINGTRDPIFNFSGLPLNYRFVYNSTRRYYEYTFFIGGLPRRVDNTLSFTTQPVPSRNIGTAALNALATNTATFRLR